MGNGALTGLDLSHFNTSSVTNMSKMFSQTNLAKLDLHGFKTENVTNMSRMFNGCQGLLDFDIGHFDASKVTSFAGMFANLPQINSLDLSHFKTKKVTDMSSMFSGDTALTDLNLMGWNTNQVGNMSQMFSNTGLVKIDLSHFKTKRLTNVFGMFKGAANLKTVDLPKWNTRKVRHLNEMFMNCPKLVNVNFHGWRLLNSISFGAIRMFAGDYQLASVDLSGFNKNNSRILQNAGNPKGLAVKLGHYRLARDSGIGHGYKHIRAVGKGTILAPKGKKYTEKQLLKLYSRPAKKCPKETYVMYNGKKPVIPKWLKIK